MKNKLTEFFNGKTVSLIGAGVSNMPLAHYASGKVKRLTVRDMKTVAELGETANELSSLGADLILGKDYLSNINDEIIFRSPGIRPDIPEFVSAVESGACLTSEMELFLSITPAKVYAITGSDGKTTTTTLTSLMLMPEGKVYLGGNIGEPLLHRYPSMTEADAVAVELSSFQLMTVDSPVEVAAITNITPNHLNWHTGMDEYTEAKYNILKKASRAVLNYDNDATRALAERIKKERGIPVTYFSLSPIPDGVLAEGDSAVWLDGDVILTCFPEEGEKRLLTRSDIKLPGLHNTANYMTAIAVTHGMTTDERILEVARTFGGVEHRLEFVRKLDGVTYINSSIDSSPTRSAAALSAINDRPVVLISGGYDKHIPYGPMADAILSSSVHTAVLTGDTGEKIFTALREHKDYEKALKEGLTVIREPDFDTAVSVARAHAKEGDTVILSPASASFDRFKNFAERGVHFKNLVNSF